MYPDRPKFGVARNLFIICRDAASFLTDRAGCLAYNFRRNDILVEKEKKHEQKMVSSIGKRNDDNGTSYGLQKQRQSIRRC